MKHRAENILICDGYFLVPYIEIRHGQTLPDDVLHAFWKAIEQEGADQLLFGAHENAITPFIDAIKAKRNHAVFAFRTGEQTPVACAWLHDIEDRTAFITFFFLREVWGRGALAMGKAIVRYLINIPDTNGGALFDRIIGEVLSDNKLAIRFGQKLGYDVVGETLREETGERVTIILMKSSRGAKKRRTFSQTLTATPLGHRIGGFTLGRQHWPQPAPTSFLFPIVVRRNVEEITVDMQWKKRFDERQPVTTYVSTRPYEWNEKRCLHAVSGKGAGFRFMPISQVFDGTLPDAFVLCVTNAAGVTASVTSIQYYEPAWRP